MNTLGLHAYAVAPAWDMARIEPQVERLKESGVRLLEMPVFRATDIDGTRAGALARRYGLELAASLTLPGSLDIMDSPSDAVAYLETAFRVCVEAGIPSLGGMVYATPGRTTGQPPTQKELDGLSRFLERAARSARSHGVRLGVQPCNRYETHLVNTAQAAARLIERIGDEALCIHLDAFHMLTEEGGFERAFAAAEPFLAHVRLSEANRGLPGRGVMDWPALFKAAAGIGYAGPLTLQCPVAPDADVSRRLSIWNPAVQHLDELLEEGLPFLRNAAKQADVDLG
jgi:D-psicose/D-tagatose/L-ribulose 3-epimerase